MYRDYSRRSLQSYLQRSDIASETESISLTGQSPSLTELRKWSVETKSTNSTNQISFNASQTQISELAVGPMYYGWLKRRVIAIQ